MSIENPFDDYCIVKLSIPEGYRWYPGGFSLLYILAKYEGRKWRVFSHASTYEDGMMTFATRIRKNPTGYKVALSKLKKDDSVYLRGPIGKAKFIYKEKPLVLIAGCVGITPIVSII